VTAIERSITLVYMYGILGWREWIVICAKETKFSYLRFCFQNWKVVNNISPTHEEEKKNQSCRLSDLSLQIWMFGCHPRKRVPYIKINKYGSTHKGVEHEGSLRGNTRAVLLDSTSLVSALPLPKCFTREQSIVRLIYLSCGKESQGIHWFPRNWRKSACVLL